MTLSNMKSKTQVFENRMVEKIGYLFYSIIFIGIFLSAFTGSGTGLAGNLLGFNTGLLYGFNKIRIAMQIDLKQSKTRLYWNALLVLEMILAVLFYNSTIGNIIVTAFSIFFIFLFTSLTQLILLYIFSNVTLTLVSLDSHMEISSQTKFLLLKNKLIYEIPYESKLILHRTFSETPGNFPRGIYYIEVKRPEGIVIHYIKLKVMPFIRMKEIEQFFKEVANFEVSPRLENSIKWEKRLIIVIGLSVIIGVIIMIIMFLFL